MHYGYRIGISYDFMIIGFILSIVFILVHSRLLLSSQNCHASRFVLLFFFHLILWKTNAASLR